MKKYVKPELFYENFELTQQVAICEFDSHGSLTDVDSCTFAQDLGNNIPGLVFFTDINQNCHNKAQGYCYHSSTGNLYNLFNS